MERHKIFRILKVYEAAEKKSWIQQKKTLQMQSACDIISRHDCDRYALKREVAAEEET